MMSSEKVIYDLPLHLQMSHSHNHIICNSGTWQQQLFTTACSILWTHDHGLWPLQLVSYKKSKLGKLHLFNDCEIITIIK